MPLKILIVGAGLAGFSAAIAVARNGHEVHVFERSAFSNEVGAALHFGPTTTAYVFPRWGIDAYRDFQACKVERWSNYHVKDEVMEPMPDRYVSLHPPVRAQVLTASFRSWRTAAASSISRATR